MQAQHTSDALPAPNELRIRVARQTVQRPAGHSKAATQFWVEQARGTGFAVRGLLGDTGNKKREASQGFAMAENKGNTCSVDASQDP